MVSPQFKTAEQQKVDGDSVPVDHVESVVESDNLPSDDQLAQAAAALNAAQDGPVDPDTFQPDGAHEAPKPPPVPPSVANRAEIANRAAKARMGEMVPGQGVGPVTDSAPPATGEAGEIDMNAQNIYYGSFGDPEKNMMGDALEAPEPSAPQATPENEIPAQEPGLGETDMVTVKVDGEELQVSRDELVRSYQKDQAANKRLNEATELLKQAQGVAAAGLQPTANTPADQSGTAESPTEPTSEPGMGYDDIDYAGIAEKIQLGEASEGADALKDLVTQVVGRSQRHMDTAQPDPSVLTEQVALAVQDRTQSQQAQVAFEQNYSDIVQDETLYGIAQRNAVELMIEDFVANGANEEMVAFARANPQQAVNAHRAARLSGQFEGLKSPDQIYTEAGNRTRQWMGRVSGNPQPQPTVPPTENAQTQPAQQQSSLPARSQRARAAQQSPTSRQAPPSQEPQKAPRIKTPSEKIEEMRRARGQFPRAYGVA